MDPQTLSKSINHVLEGAVRGRKLTKLTKPNKLFSRTASMMLQKAQFVDVLSSAIHWTSSLSLGGITSVGFAVGLAFAMAVFDDAITQGGNIDV
jgi:hypothetical protein